MSTKVTKEIIEVPISHPLEKVFNIEEGTSMVSQVIRTTEVVVAKEYDDKDVEIEEHLNEVYNAAMGAFETQAQETELVEGKYKARSGEVAVQFLNTALEAAKSKSTVKMHKDKIAAATVGTAPKTVNNNLFVGDRNELLKNLRNLDLEANVIEAKPEG